MLTADQPSGHRAPRLAELFGAAGLGWLVTVGIVCGRMGLAMLWGARRSPLTARRVSDTLSMGLIYLIATGLVTALTVVLLVWPYFALREPGTLWRRPWRLYVEPCLLGLACMVALQATVLRIQAEPLLLQMVPTGLFAALTSLFSSFFLQRRLTRKALPNGES